MKNARIRIMLVAALAVASASFISCRDDDSQTVDDQLAAQVAEQFVDHTVAPTYTALAAKAELLASQLAALRQNPTNAGVEEACQTFLDAREQWEKSEAFLFGAAGDFGIDPHIDSWPLDEDAFRTLMYESPAAEQSMLLTSLRMNGFTPPQWRATCVTAAISWKWAGWAARLLKAIGPNWKTWRWPIPWQAAATAMVKIW